ncbi:hypothetical protein KHC28_19340 [Ancylobacter sonchi]|uniref:hypothetical protein n=1 Tax=Ancylobacter sonchi TaxID=1937790 RepID=UPI001BD6B5D8|nr:hypothetical protein [Ancylobacter sonchi]MBS7535812.1 hypothetical protein [Ancylobacter sonchi]
MSLKRAALLLLLGGAIVPAIAQQITLPVGTPPAADKTSADAPVRPKVDESALRYFASQGDTRRLEAEIARLRALYPDWSPPADLFGPQTDPDLERMWKLYADGKLSDVRSAIAARQASDPSWQPPPELIARVTESENRRRLINASDAQQWSTVLRMATETPGLLTCSNVDILWRVAEAFGKTNQVQRALDAYTYLLTNCNDAAERLATVQKAMPMLDDAQLKQLLALERKDPQGQPEFAPIRDELIRRRMGRAAENPEYVVAPDDLTRMEALARAGDTPGDPLLLGWYLFRHDESSRALDWFKLALDRKGGAKAAEGYVLALNSLGRALEAEPIAFEWRDAAPENGKAYLDVVISLLTASPPPVLAETVLSRFSPVVMRDKYVPGAQALGWYAYNTGQLVVSQAWFQTALSWDPNDEPSSYGLALTYWRLNDAARLNALVQNWRGRSERIVALVDPQLRATLEARNLQGQINRSTNPLVAAALRVTPPPADGNLPAAGLGYAPVPAQAGVQPMPGQPAATHQFQPIPAQTAAPQQFQPVPTQSATAPQFQPVPTQAAPTQLAPARPAQPILVQTAPAQPAGRNYAQPVNYQGAAPAPRPRAASSGGASRGGGGAAALSRGWRLMELNRPIEAVTAFDEALRTGSGKVAEEAAYGKALAYMRKGMTNQAQVAAIEAPQSPRRAMQLTADILAQRAYEFYKDQRYVEALISLDERARITPEQQDLMMLRGWSYFNIRDYQSAERIFRALAAQGNTDAMNGVSEIEFARRLYKRE